MTEDSAAEPRAVDGDYLAPRTEVETALTRIWGEVLGLGRVGVADDFFELGGNSVVGLRLLAAVRERVGVTLTMRELLDAPTIADVAALVEERRDAPPPADEPIPRVSR
jgi:acyl carrier protein